MSEEERNPDNPESGAVDKGTRREAPGQNPDPLLEFIRGVEKQGSVFGPDAWRKVSIYSEEHFKRTGEIDLFSSPPKKIPPTNQGG